MESGHTSRKIDGLDWTYSCSCNNFEKITFCVAVGVPAGLRILAWESHAKGAQLQESVEIPNSLYVCQESSSRVEGLKASGDRCKRTETTDKAGSLTLNNADLRNIGGKSACAITAALFLQEFVKGDKPFAHIDMAGPAYSAKLQQATGLKYYHAPADCRSVKSVTALPLAK
eukprot:scaffold29636_cov50-Attheya_sp.AAC.3